MSRVKDEEKKKEIEENKWNIQIRFQSPYHAKMQGILNDLFVTQQSLIF